MSGKLDVDFFVGGSGIHSQSTACANALSRALYKAFPRLKKILRRAGLVTMDRRIK
jgi:ribosomal protein S9